MKRCRILNLVADQWLDYEILDAGEGKKLERWGNVILSRPDPQVIWPMSKPALWKKADAIYHRSSSGGGHWEMRENLPGKWTVSYRDLNFYVEPTGFKHTGLFPEQASNWDWMRQKIQQALAEGREVKVLNLFGYTGAASVACAAAGAKVCHVDASKGMVTRARENMLLSGLDKAEVRYLVDDAFKFVSREVRRGNHYDGILMDPPSYGRGPGGEVWKLEDQLSAFVEETAGLLSENALFFLLNSYTTGLSSLVTGNLLQLLVQKGRGGKVSCGDLCLPIRATKDLLLPCGSFARWEA